MMTLSAIKEDGCDGDKNKKEDEAKLWPQYLAVLTGWCENFVTNPLLPY